MPAETLETHQINNPERSIFAGKKGKGKKTPKSGGKKK